MQYYLCPRCQFRIAGNKHVCGTCGLNVAAHKSTISGVNEEAEAAPAKANMFSKFLKLDARRSKETQEKPALG